MNGDDGLRASAHGSTLEVVDVTQVSYASPLHSSSFVVALSSAHGASTGRLEPQGSSSSATLVSCDWFGTGNFERDARSFVMEVFNVKFVGEVEKYPQLYNYTLKEYSKRDATEKAWNQIATEMKMSVSECKEKWRNLRSTFAKNLKPKKSGSGRTGKRPYYLMEAMNFAIPFMKVAGNPSGNLPSSSSTTEGGEVDVGQEEETLSTEDLASPEIASPVVGPPKIASPAPSQQDQATPGPSTGTRGPHGYPVRKRKLKQDAEQAFSDYFAAKKAKLAPKEGIREEGIRHFLLSLMPDLVQMNDVQVREFKRRVLELVGEVGGFGFIPPKQISGSAGYPYGYPDYAMLAPALPQQTPGHSHSTDG